MDALNKKITRRQFGLGVMGALAALLFGRFLNIFGRAPSAFGGHTKARFWSRADHLAG